MKQVAVVLLAILSGNAVRGSGEVDCNRCADNTTFDNFGDAINYFIQCSYPFQNFNPSCVAAACPKLSSVCPYNSDGSADATAMASLGPILTACVQSQSVICGVTMASLQQPPHSFTTSTLIPPSLATGICKLNPGTGLVEHLNDATFTFPKEQNSGCGGVNMTITLPNFNYQGGYTCTFNVPTLNPSTVTFPNMHGIANFTVTDAATINPGQDSPGSIQVEEKCKTLSLKAGNFSAMSLSLPQILVDKFNVAATAFFDKSPAGTSATRFLATLAASGIQAAKQCCTRNN